jgi:hypothetical protein
MIDIEKIERLANGALGIPSIRSKPVILDLIAELRTTREAKAEAIKLMCENARRAGEAEGKLKTSEAAGIVEGWMERCKKAEDALAKAPKPVTVGWLSDTMQKGIVSWPTGLHGVDTTAQTIHLVIYGDGK